MQSLWLEVCLWIFFTSTSFHVLHRKLLKNSQVSVLLQLPVNHHHQTRQHLWSVFPLLFVLSVTTLLLLKWTIILSIARRHQRAQMARTTSSAFVPSMFMFLLIMSTRYLNGKQFFAASTISSKTRASTSKQRNRHFQATHSSSLKAFTVWIHNYLVQPVAT